MPKFFQVTSYGQNATVNVDNISHLDENTDDLTPRLYIKGVREPFILDEKELAELNKLLSPPR